MYRTVLHSTPRCQVEQPDTLNALAREVSIGTGALNYGPTSSELARAHRCRAAAFVLCVPVSLSIQHPVFDSLHGENH